MHFPDGHKPIVDLSHHNVIADYNTLHGEVDGAILKATEGRYWRDPEFTKHSVGCRTAGIPLGAYHFARPNPDNPGDVHLEIGNFVNTINGHDYPLGVWLDWEATAFHGRLTELSADYVDHYISAWLDRLPDMGVYASYNIIAAHHASNMTPWWVAYWGTWVPPHTMLGQPVRLWQYCSQSRLPGIDGRVDLSHQYDEPITV